jgi:hypothetical protein
MIDYSEAREFADEVRALAIVMSGEDETMLSKDGRAMGLLQQTPVHWIRYARFLMPHDSDSWTTGQIRLCAAYLAQMQWTYSGQGRKDLIIMAYKLGEDAVFNRGYRDDEFVANFKAELAKVRTKQ